MNLITGGSGFIGSYIARKLIERGERVRVLDIVEPELSAQKGKFEFCQVDIRNKQQVIDACKDVRRIFHIVSLVPISKAGRGFWDVNVQGTRNIMDGAVKYGVSKILHMSSSAVYDLNQQNPLDENSRIDPLGVYGHSKHDGEQVCFEYRKKGLDISIVRPRTVIGPERLGIFSILFDWIRAGKNIYIIGPGKNKIQFIEVGELADACILITEKASNDVFNIGTDRFGTLREDLEELIRHAGSSSKIVGLNPAITISLLKTLDKLNLSPLADWHYLTYHKDFYFDISKAKNVLGWQPKYSNAEMLIQAYRWYLSNLEKVRNQVGTTHKMSLRQGILRLIRSCS